jgi:hypothetical protein
MARNSRRLDIKNVRWIILQLLMGILPQDNYDAHNCNAHIRVEITIERVTTSNGFSEKIVIKS